MPGRIDVEVNVVGGEGIPTVDVNSFRAFPDGPDFLLDFIQADDEKAEVLSRLRVVRGFVTSIIDRCQAAGA